MKKLFNVVLKDNLLGCPFAPNKKNGLGAAGLGLAIAAPSLFASIVNAQSSSENAESNRKVQRETNELGAELQRETNQLNADLTRETNMQNQALFDKSLNWQTEMWQKTNEYNEPKNVVQRMLNAGVNPSIGLGSGGVASTMGSPSAPSMQAATMQAFKPSVQNQDISAGQINLDGVYNAVNAFTQSRLADQSIKESQSRTHGNDLANEFSAKTLTDRVKQLSHLARIDEANEEFYKNQARYSTATFEARQALEFGNVKLQEVQLENAFKSLVSMQLDIDAKQIENRWLPVLKQDQHNQFIQALDTAKAEIGLILANQTLTNAQANTEIQKKIGQIIDNGMKGVDFDVKKSTKSYLIGMAKEQLYEMEDARFMRPVDFYKQHLGKAAGYTITPGAASATGVLMDTNNKRNRFGMQHNETFRPHY